MGCGSLTSSFGPFDYRTVSTSNRLLVENAHFLPKVEMLKEGNSASRPGPDIAYTLHVMPNHPRALLAMERLSAKEHALQPSGARYTAECYMIRGIEFTPDDPMPHMIYAIFLKNRNRKEGALKEALQAESLAGEPTGFELDYNMGLLFFDLGMYDKAEMHSDRAYALGAAYPGLRKKISTIPRKPS